MADPCPIALAPEPAGSKPWTVGTAVANVVVNVVAEPDTTAEQEAVLFANEQNSSTLLPLGSWNLSSC